MSFAQGVAIFSSCKKAESIPHFTKRLSANPNDYYARYYRGRAYEITGRNQEAMDDFRFLMTSSKGAERSVANAKLIMLERSPRDAANFLITNAIGQYPESGLVYSVLGRILTVDLNEYDEAIPYLRRAVQIEHPLIGSAFYDLGTILNSKRDYQQAEGYFRRALSRHETMTIAHLGLAEAFTGLGRLREADEHFERAAELNPILYGKYYASKKLPPKLDINEHNSKKVGSFSKRKYYMPKEYQGQPNKNVWFVQDTAGHAECRYKIYLEKDGFLNFECGTDEYGRRMKKHESMAGHRIRTKDLNIEKHS